MPNRNKPAAPEQEQHIRTCPACGSTMIMQSLEWDGETQEPTYRCPECGREEVVSKNVDEKE